MAPNVMKKSSSYLLKGYGRRPLMYLIHLLLQRKDLGVAEEAKPSAG